MKRSSPTVPQTARALLLLATAGLALAAPARAQELMLGEAVDAALAAHPALAAATARATAADEASGVARGDRLPAVSLAGNLTHFEEPMIVAPLHSLDLSTPPVFDRDLVQGRLALGYTVFDGGARSSRVRGADAQAEATAFGRSDAEMTVIEETASAYMAVLGTEALRQAAAAQVAALELEEGRAQQALDAGTAAQVEVLRARAALQDARAGLATAEARVGVSIRRLARLMGVDPVAIAPDRLVPVRARAAVDPVADVADGSSSPLVLRADRVALAAEARLAGEKATRLPSLQADGAVLSYGYLSGNHVAEWQAGLHVSWPVFTGGARRASVRRAEAELAAARSDAEATRLQVEQAVDAAEASVVEADAREEALALAVAQWEEVARIEALALEAGSGVQSDLLRAEADLFQARAGYVSARYDAVLSRIRVARAAGTLDRSWMDEALEASR